MFRTLCLLFGLVLVSVPLAAGLSRPGDPPLSELESARGGNIEQGKGSERCDQEAGVYIGCTAVDGFCRQCLTEQDDGSLEANIADWPDPNIPPDNDTGYMFGMNSQDCGNYFDGTCVVDNNSPTGYRCVASDTMNTCTEGIFEVIPQTDYE